MIVVDTSVWSRAWRRSTGQQNSASAVLAGLIEARAPLAVPGLVVQELLSGLKSATERRRLESLLEPFPTLLATREHHLFAATIHSDCRANGVAASAIDCLISATTISVAGELLTCDTDFQRIATSSALRVRLLAAD